MSRRKKGLVTRKQNTEELIYRQMSVRATSDGLPESIDEDSRSVEAVVATEEPALVFDYERYEVISEILLMDGVEMPKSRKVPMLDTHSRFDTNSVLGSVRDIKVSGGQLVGRSYFSTVQEAEGPWTKVREGHLTDFSVGYRILPGASEWVPDGETAVIKGKRFVGPVMVRKKWRLKEVSLVPVGADELAKVRSEPQKKVTKEVNNMDPKFREWLISRGMPAEFTDEQAEEFAAKLEIRVADDGSKKKKKEPEIDVDKIRAEATDEVRAQITEIEAMCTRFECVDMFPQLVRDKKSVDEAREIIMELLVKRAKESDELAHRGPVALGADERDKFRDAATDALLIRSGNAPEKPAEGADDLTGYSLREMARHALMIAGKKTTGRPMEMIGRALITSDLPYLLANVANKSLFAGFDTAPETWRTWCGTGSVPDFKTNYLPRVSESSDLEEVPEHGEYKYGKRAEAQESYSIATYGKLFAITRQTIINDDLGALTNIPAGHGEAAARKIGDVAYAVLTANAAMGDGVALFASGHSNFVAGGSGAAPGTATIAAGILAMKNQKDLQGLRRLNIRPEYFIGPNALEGAAEVFFQTIQFSDSDTIATDSSLASTRKNLYAGSYFTRVYDGRLDDNDAAAWFLAGPKNKTITVFFLDGVETPYLETKSGWSVDGTEYKVRIDCGAKAVDWKALYMNDGN